MSFFLFWLGLLAWLVVVVDLIGSSPKNGLRQSKLVCTIGPKTASKEMMIKLAETGMNVVRMNMSHGTHEWHQMVIDITKEINEEGVYNLGLLLDTKGPEVRSGDLKNPIEVERGQEFIWTIRKELPSELGKFVTEVSYDDFVNDVHVGDTLLVDGGICSFLIKEVRTLPVNFKPIEALNATFCRKKTMHNFGP